MYPIISYPNFIFRVRLASCTIHSANEVRDEHG